MMICYCCWRGRSGGKREGGVGSRRSGQEERDRERHCNQLSEIDLLREDKLPASDLARNPFTVTEISCHPPSFLSTTFVAREK